MSEDVSFYEPETELVDKICAGGFPELLADLFMRRTQRWPHPYMHIEVGTIGTFSDLEQRLLPPVAFGLVPHACRIVIAQRVPKLLATAFSLLCGLVRASDTTELPPGLAADWEQLRQQAAVLSPNEQTYWKGLCKWYRRA